LLAGRIDFVSDSILYGDGRIDRGEPREAAMTQYLPPPACIVKVGEGRGFIVEYRVKFRHPKSRLKQTRKSGLRTTGHVKNRLVVTAAHCLPKLPPSHAGAYSSDRTYDLLGSLDGTKNGVWAECLFVNPVADIAVLGCPDDQELGDQADLYNQLADAAPSLRIGTARTGRGWVLSLDGKWIRTSLEIFSGLGGVSLSIDPTLPGMSGSPVLNDAGRAVAVAVIGCETESKSGKLQNERAGPQPILSLELPGWLLRGN
jgi:hypothetical protein